MREKKIRVPEGMLEAAVNCYGNLKDERLRVRSRQRGSKEVIATPPVLCERLCDGGKTNMEAGELLKYTNELVRQYGEAFMLQHKHFPGCGTLFQWYFGSNCWCPECGHLYQVIFTDLKNGKYTPKSV